MLSHGLHMTYWQANADRDALDAKVEVIVWHVTIRPCPQWSLRPKAFDAALRHAQEGHRQTQESNSRNHYERLGLAPRAKPTGCLSTCLNQSTSGACQLILKWERHLYVEGDGQFRAEPGRRSREC